MQLEKFDRTEHSEFRVGDFETVAAYRDYLLDCAHKYYQQQADSMAGQIESQGKSLAAYDQNFQHQSDVIVLLKAHISWAAETIRQLQGKVLAAAAEKAELQERLDDCREALSS